MKKQILFLMFIGILFSCTSSKNNGNNSTDNSKSSKSDDSQTVEMRINHYRNTGVGMGPMLVMLVQKGDEIGTDKWTQFSSKIEGFTYEPGHIYDLTVNIEKVDNPPADASSIKYTLKELKSVQDVDPEKPFDINLKFKGLNFVRKAPDYKLVGQVDIDCGTLCDELDERLSSQNDVVGTFIRLESNKIQLIGFK
ncbi:MAG: DUF4377 domain-containing protein [Bacteroidales bacterium]